jgi:hypothetical protein
VRLARWLAAALITASPAYGQGSIGANGGGIGGNTGGGTPYTLPIATNTTLGGIKPDQSTLTVNATTGLASANGCVSGCTIAGLTVTGSFAATGLVTNADLVNAATTVNGVTCTLGTTCTITASAGTITVGTTTVSGGTSGDILYNNAGTLANGLISGDCTSTILAVTCTKTNGTNFGTAATVNTGTSGATLGLLNGNLTFSGTLTFSGLATGTQAGCLGLTAGNAVVASGAACGSGSGTVTAVSVASANGFAGSSSGGATPALTLTTSITGILSGNGTAISAATTTGTGSVVLATSPSLTTPALGTPSSATLTNATGLPISSGVSGLGTGVATAAANAVNASGGFVTSAQTYLAAIAYSWDSGTTVANATVPLANPQYASGGTITSVTYYTAAGSFTADVEIGGTGVTGCSALSVTSTTTTTSCTAANTFTNTSAITVVITSASGSPDQALVQVNFTHGAN